MREHADPRLLVRWQESNPRPLELGELRAVAEQQGWLAANADFSDDEAIRRGASANERRQHRPRPERLGAWAPGRDYRVL